MSSHTEPSWCRTIQDSGTAEATFRWTIDNFKDRPEKAGESLDSTCFTLNGSGELKTKWQLRIYPKGEDKDGDEDYVSVFLLTKEKSKVKAKYVIGVIDGAGMEREAFKCQGKVFSGKSSSWGLISWLNWDKFNDHPDLLLDGKLTLKCTITVIETERIISGSDLDSEYPGLSGPCQCQKNIGQQLGNVFSDKQLSDIKIECDGQSFDCHQVILAARSQVFMAMFQSNMKEKETKIVTIDEFKAEVVSEMLNYIYTGTVSSNGIRNIAVELLAAADKYQLDLLKNICEESLCSKLGVTNCVELFVVGDMYQTLKLRKMALRLAAKNMNSIIDTDVFKDLFQQKPVLAWEVTKASHNN